MLACRSRPVAVSWRLLPAVCAVATCGALLACAAPTVRLTDVTVAREQVRRLAVVPFYPAPGLRGRARGGGSGVEAAEQVGRYVVEALQSEGYAVVPPSDVALAFDVRPEVLPRGDAAAAAKVAGAEFGATAVLLGEVTRWAERSDEVAGARPASVAFRLSLHEAPGGRRLWSAVFDETQQPLSRSISNLWRYPGGGLRWLEASELARWGADAAVAELPPPPR